jgi:hypothetical protein
MFTYNTMNHSATGYTPYELVFGHKFTLPSALKDTPGPQYNYDDYASELSRLQPAHQMAKENLISSKTKSKEYYGQKTETFALHAGDRVLL